MSVARQNSRFREAQRNGGGFVAGAFWPVGSEYAWDAIRGRFAINGHRTPQADALLFTRASAAEKTDGTIAAIDAMRAEAAGILYEPAKDNLIQTPSFSSATVGVIGSGGAFPSPWNFSQTALVREVVSKSKRTIRMRANRTGGAPSTTSLTFRSSASASFPVVTGPIAASGKLTLVSFSGAFANIGFGVQEQTAAGATVGTTLNAPLTVAGTSTQEIKWRNIPNANKAAFVVVTNLSDATADFEVVFELEFPQLEYQSDAIATSWMNSEDVTDPRSADAAKLLLPASGAKLVGSFYELGGYWDAVTIADDEHVLTPRGSKSNRLVAATVLDDTATFDQRTVAANKLSPPVFSDVTVSTVTLDGKTWSVHRDTDRAYAVRKASNKQSAYRFEVHSGDYWDGEAQQDRNRSELSCGTKMPVFDTDIWYSDAFRVVSVNYDDITQHLIVGQLHATEDGGDISTAPIFSFQASASGLLVKTATAATGPTSPVAQTTRLTWGGLVLNKWVRRVVRIKPNNAGAAELQVWLDGQEVLALTGISIGYPDAIGPYFKTGAYIRDALPSWSKPIIVENANVETGTASLVARVTTPLDIV